MRFDSPASTKASDSSLIALSGSRPEAFAIIFDRHFAAIHAYLSRRVGRARADDLASTTFAVAFERRSDFRPDADSARPWLFGIATNLLRNERRAELRTLQMLARLRQVPDAGTAAPGGIDPRLAAVLAELDPSQRDVLLLYAWGELSYDEIAASLEVPVGTVRSRLSRAHEQLRQALTSGEESGAAKAQEASG